MRLHPSSSVACSHPLALQRAVKDETPAPSLKLALSVLRMSCWDADVFFKFKQTLIDRSTHASDKQQVRA